MSLHQMATWLYFLRLCLGFCWWGPLLLRTSMLSRGVGWGWGGWHKGSNIRKKNISGREASGDVWGGLSMPNGLPRALPTHRKQITNKSKFSGSVGEAWGRSGDYLGYHRTLYRRIQPSTKNTFLTNQILTNFDLPARVLGQDP